MFFFPPKFIFYTRFGNQQKLKRKIMEMKIDLIMLQTLNHAQILIQRNQRNLRQVIKLEAESNIKIFKSAKQISNLEGLWC